MQKLALLTVLTALSLPAQTAVRAVMPGCCASIPGSLTVMNSSTGAIERSLSTGLLTGGYGGSEGAAVTKDGKSVAILNDISPTPGSQYMEVTLVSLTSGQILGSVETQGQVNGVYIAVNLQSGAIYAVYDDLSTNTSRVQEVDPVTLTVIRDRAINGFLPNALAVSPDGERIYVSTPAGVDVLQTSSLETIGTITLPGQAGALAVSPGSSTLYATYPSDSPYPDTVAFVNTATLQVTQSVPLGTFALGMALSPDGSQIYMPGETSLAILDVSTLALSIAPLAVGKIAVAPDGTVYGDNTSSIVVIDPVLWTVTATYAADDANFFALSLDGSRLYLFSSQSSLVSMTGAVPSETLTRSAPTGDGPEYGAYDAKDGLVLLPDFWGNVNVLDSKTLRLRGSVMTGYPCFWVVFGDTGYAVCGSAGEQPGPQVTQFDPVSLKVTGSVTIPYPADDDTGFYAQPVLDANFLYVPFNFYPASSGVRPAGTGSPAATGAVSYGIAVIDIAKMALAAIFPLNVAEISGFAIAPGTGKGYLSIAQEFPYSGGLLEINLRTGAVLRTAQLPENGYVAAAPDGSTIYVSTPGTLYAVSTQTLTIVNSATGLYFGYLSVTPYGAYIYGTTNSGVTIVSTSSLAVEGTIPSTATTNPGAVIFVQD